MGEQEKSELLLFPALGEQSWDIEANLENWAQDLAAYIKTVNFSIIWLLESNSYLSIISNSFDQFTQKVKDFYDAIINDKHWNIWKENFIKYLNFLFLLLNVRKIYNTSPRDSFSEFQKSPCNDQLVRMVIPKWQDLPFLDITTWGSCHNYSIIFKDFFSQLWIDSTIIYCNPVSNHSFLLVNIFWEYYMVDPLFNEKWFITKVSVWDQIQIWFDHYWIIKSFNPFFVDRFKIWENDIVRSNQLKTFDDSELFANRMDERDIKYIITENYINSIMWTFKLEIWKENGDNFFIRLNYWEDEQSFTLNFRKIANLFKWVNIRGLSNRAIIMEIIKYTYSKIWKKVGIPLDIVEKCVWEIAYMIKRDDLLSLLNLK